MLSFASIWLEDGTPHTQKEEIWMKRKSLSTLVCALLASLALTTFAFADNGPKPQLIVRVKNAPQEPYYLDLLAKGDWDAEDGNRIDGIDWNYDGKEDTLDPDLLALLRDNVPAGWHACVAQGTTGAPMWGELFDKNGRTTEYISIYPEFLKAFADN